MTSLNADTDRFLELASGLGLTISPEAAAPLVRYLQEVVSWNQQLNLTRHDTLELYVQRDILDTVKLAEHIPKGATILDVGSGGGVPGIPLAILRPDLKVTLCESVGKKARALESMCQALSLPVEVSAQRVQALLKERSWSVLTIRAVAAMDKLLSWFEALRKSETTLLMIKGPRWTIELEEAKRQRLTSGFHIRKLSSWSCPGRDGESVLVRVLGQTGL